MENISGKVPAGIPTETAGGIPEETSEESPEKIRGNSQRDF